MHPSFTAAFFSANRAALRQRLQSDAPLVLAANGLLQRTADSAYPFQQDSNFWYLTGLDEPDLVLVMTASHDYLIVPSRDQVRQAFDGAIATETFAARSGINQVETARAGWARLRQELVASSQVWVCGTPGGYDKRHGLWHNPATAQLRRKLKLIHPGVTLQAADTHMASLRVIKQPTELAAMQHAIDITTATLGDVRRQLAQFANEYEIEAALTHGFRSRGASGHGFSPIVAGGAHATVLHHVANNGVLQKNQLTVLDVGAEVAHYAADITRTVSVQQPSSRQRAVFEAVQEAQSYALLLLKPGVVLREYERNVAIYIGRQLQRLGLADAADDVASIRRYYPHASSHFLGLDVHDVGDYNQPLQAGMVVTCEPGIYIPEEGIGVRIEDDVLITETDNRVLSAACPTTLRNVQ